MSILPDQLNSYKKFLFFIISHRNSAIFKNNTGGELKDLDEDEGEETTTDYSGPEDLVEDLIEMGPTYIKLGQLLSTRPDLLPDHYLEALAELQDDVESIPFEQVREMVEEDIGMRISKAFEYFEEEPMATASIGQVHKAKLTSGKEVAVKIRRPGVKKDFLEDLNTLKKVADLAVKHNKTARQYGFDNILEEFRHMLLKELDYTREAENLVTLGRNLKEFKHLFVPQPIADYSSSRVLTMEYVKGKKVTELSSLKMMETDFSPVVDELVKAYLKQIVFDGFAHADPHPGNIHLMEDNRIALMDLGMVARFSPTLQEDILKLLIAIGEYQIDEVANIIIGMSTIDEEVDLTSFRKNVARLVMDHQYRQAKDMQTGQLIIQINRMASESGIKIAVQLNILGKILLNMDKIVATLTPNFDFQKAISKNVESMMFQKAKKEIQPHNFFAKALETKRLMEQLPERVNKITKNLAENKFEIKVNALDEKRLTSDFQKVANRITLGLIIASMIIGASLLMRVSSTFSILGYPGLPMLLFIFAAIAGIVLVVNILLRDEDFRRK